MSHWSSPHKLRPLDRVRWAVGFRAHGFRGLKEQRNFRGVEIGKITKNPAFDCNPNAGQVQHRFQVIDTLSLSRVV